MAAATPRQQRAECRRCLRAERVCVCAALPPAPVHTQTSVLVVQSRREADRRVISTTPLIPLVMSNARVLISSNATRAEIESVVGGAEQLLFVFPGPRAVDLESLVPTVVEKEHGKALEGSGCVSAVCLVFVDGTWREAKQLWNRSTGFHDLLEEGKAVQVRFAEGGMSKYKIRSEPREHCLSTIESLAYALGLVEPSADPVCGMLLNAFECMVAHQASFMPPRKHKDATDTTPCLVQESAPLIERRPGQLRDYALIRSHAMPRHHLTSHITTGSSATTPTPKR